MRGVLKIEAPRAPADPGKLLHADPPGRANVRVLHERGTQNRGAKGRGHRPAECDMPTPVGGQM